jgi:hypothetical protein
MRTTISLVGRIIITALIFSWWTAGIVFVHTEFHASSLIYVIPLEIVGLVMAWKVADPDRLF